MCSQFFFLRTKLPEIGGRFNLDHVPSFCKNFMKFSVYEILIMWRKYKIWLTIFFFILSQNCEILKIQLTFEIEN